MFKKIFRYILVILLISGFTANAMDVSKMSTEQKLGQMTCLCFRQWNGEPVTKMNDHIKQIISDFHVGAVILYGMNFVDEAQVKQLVEDFQTAANKG